MLSRWAYLTFKAAAQRCSHQNRSIFPERPNFYQEVKFTYEHLWIFQEAAVLRTAPFPQEDVSRTAQKLPGRWTIFRTVRFPRKPNMPIFSGQLKLIERWYNFRTGEFFPTSYPGQFFSFRYVKTAVSSTRVRGWDFPRKVEYLNDIN